MACRRGDSVFRWLRAGWTFADLRPYGLLQPLRVTNIRILLFLLSFYLECLRCFQQIFAARHSGRSVIPRRYCHSLLLAFTKRQGIHESLGTWALLPPQASSLSSASLWGRVCHIPNLWCLRVTPAASGSVIRRMWPWTPLAPTPTPVLGRLNLLPQQPPLTHIAKGLWQQRDQPDGLS